MSTLIALITRAGRPGSAGRRAWGLAIPLLAAGALAAGCGSASSSGSAAGGAAHSTATATPVPTVSGGSVAAGSGGCVGWPADASSVALSASFVPVSVERCVTGATAIPGRGLWTTATLQRSTSNLSALITALHQPAVGRKAGTVCPAIAVNPPQVVLINAAGQKVIPRLPASDCGLTTSAVVTALNSLHWQAVSVRLIAQVSGGAPPSTTQPATVPPSSATTQPVTVPPALPATTPTGGAVHPG